MLTFCQNISVSHKSCFIRSPTNRAVLAKFLEWATPHSLHPVLSHSVLTAEAWRWCWLDEKGAISFLINQMLWMTATRTTGLIHSYHLCSDVACITWMLASLWLTDSSEVNIWTFWLVTLLQHCCSALCIVDLSPLWAGDRTTAIPAMFKSVNPQQTSPCPPNPSLLRGMWYNFLFALCPSW